MNTTTELYRIVDLFLAEAKDQNGNDRSLERLNADRHLAVEALAEVVELAVEAGVKAEATRRDGIEHAIEQSIIDKHITNERNRITQWAMEVLPFYPEAQKALIEFLSDNK